VKRRRRNGREFLWLTFLGCAEYLRIWGELPVEAVRLMALEVERELGR
jgi:hypothetical protein